MEWYLKVVKNYVGFTGRARRTEFWMFYLISTIIYVVLVVISSSLGQLYSLAVILPTIAVGIRRMHDTNRSGWWIVVPIANIVFAATEGERNENQFGPDPKAGEAA